MIASTLGDAEERTIEMAMVQSSGIADAGHRLSGEGWSALADRVAEILREQHGRGSMSVPAVTYCGSRRIRRSFKSWLVPTPVASAR